MKKSFRLLLPTLLLLCLCACGGDPADDPGPTPAPPVVEDKIAFPDDRLPAPLFPDEPLSGHHGW